MKYLIIIISIFLVLVALFVFLQKGPNSLADQFALWNIYVKHIEGFNIETRESETSGITKVTARKGGRVFFVKRIANVSRDFADTYREEQNIKLESIFDPARSPYFAVLTKTIECPKDFLPTYQELSKDKSYYVLFANERFNYGACSQDLIAYRAINGIVYCKNTGDLYHLEYFIPNEEYNEVLTEVVREFTCSL